MDILATIFAVWLILSVPAALFMGAVSKRREAQVPDLSAEHQAQMRRFGGVL